MKTAYNVSTRKPSFSGSLTASY